MFVGDPSVLSADELERELAAQAAHVDAGLCGLLELVAECERRLPLALEGTTFAGWLAWRCSLLPRQAREHERIGKRLAELPLTHGAFARGELSYAKVSVLTRVAEPECEEQLIELAGVMTASQLERAIGALRRLSREEARAQQEREFLDYFWTEEGWLSVRARLAAEEGALLVQALEKAREALWQRRRPEEVAAGAGDASDAAAPVEPAPARVTNAEALVTLAELALAHEEGDRSGGERYQVVVHVDAETLAEDAGGRCELAGGRPLAAETARRLSCDASLVELREREGELLSLGRKRRTVSPPLRRALIARDRGCRFPGCERSRFVDAHHVQHWSQGGETSLDNLVVLCRRHHRLVHEHGYTLRLGDDGEPRFENQHGVAIVSVPRPPPSNRQALRERHRRLRLQIDSDSCRNGTGDRMNLSLTVDALTSIAS
jgi:Domain of unknown function (DUF222)/HNH endonuclease